MGDYREPKAADYLDETVKDTDALKKGTTSQGNIKPKHFIPLEEQVNITDEVDVNPNKIELSEQVNVEDAVEVISAESGEFEVQEGADILPLRISYDNETATDESGNGFNGTLSSGVEFESTEDPVLLQGLSLEGDANTEYHEIPHDAKLNGGTNGAHAVEFWIYLRSAPSTFRNIFCKGNNQTNNSERAPMVLLNSNRTIGYRKGIAGPNQQSLDVGASFAIPLNTLTHVVCQFDTTIGMEVWIDAVRRANNASHTTAMQTNSQNLRIGRAVGTIGAAGLATSPDILISRPKFYNRALTSAEIQNLKNNRLSIVDHPAIVDFSDIGA